MARLFARLTVGVPGPELLLAAACWALAVVGLVGEVDHPPWAWSRWDVQHVAGYTTWLFVAPLVLLLVRRFPLRAGATGSALVLPLALYVSLGLVAPFLAGAVEETVHLAYVHEPGQRSSWGSAAASQLTGGHLGWHGRQSALYLTLLTLALGGQFYRGQAARARREAALRSQLAEARLRALRMQLNPHFLFNALNTISGLAERDPKATRRVVARLGTLLRRALEGAERPLVPLREELAFLDDYLAVVEARFGGRLTVRVTAPDALLDAIVPDLLLQPLVENAVEHGAGEADRPVGIEVQAWQEGAVLGLAVCDDGPGFPDGFLVEDDVSRPTPSVLPQRARPRVGLQNVRARLSELYGEAGRLTLRPRPGGGVCAEVRLPLYLGTSDGPSDEQTDVDVSGPAGATPGLLR